MNWKVRIKNELFWVTLVPAVLLLIQQVAGLFGYQIEIAGLSDKLIAIIGTVFAILSILGICVDPTTKGVNDSKNAMLYESPKEDL